LFVTKGVLGGTVMMLFFGIYFLFKYRNCLSLSVKPRSE